MDNNPLGLNDNNSNSFSPPEEAQSRAEFKSEENAAGSTGQNSQIQTGNDSLTENKAPNIELKAQQNVVEPAGQADQALSASGNEPVPQISEPSENQLLPDKTTQDEAPDNSISAGGNVPPPPWLNQEEDKELPESSEEEKKDKASGIGKVKSLLLKLGAIVLALLFLGFIGFLVVKVLIPRLQKPQGTSDLPTGKQIVLTYWGLWESPEIIQTVIDKFEQENPNVKINYQQSSYQDYSVRLQSALANKKSDSTSGPDIFRYHNTWLPMLINELSPLDNKQIKVDDYYPVVKKDLMLNSQLYGVPLMYDGLALYYNTQLFSNAGKQVPTSWEELQKTAAELTVLGENGRIQIAGIALGTSSNIDHFSDILGLMMLQNNANLADPTDDLASDALTFYTLFTTRDKVWDETLPSSVYAFATGKVAMIFAPSWRAFDIKNINPELDFKTAPVPQLPDSKVAWANYWAEGVAASSKYKEEANNFLAFLSQDDNLRLLYNQASKVRLFGEPYPKLSLASELENDPVVGAFVSQAPYAQSWYMASGTHDSGIDDKIIKYYENAVNSVVNDGEDSTAALSTAAQGVSQVLSSYRVNSQ